MNVERALGLGHVEHFLIRPRYGFAGQTLDSKVPLSQLDFGRDPGVQDRESICHVLAGGHPGGVDASLGQLCLSTTQEGHAKGG